MPKELPNITMVCVDTKNHAQALKAIRKSLEQITPAKTIFFTDVDLEIEGVEVVKIAPLASKEEYSRFFVKSLYNYLILANEDFEEEGHVLIIQHDGYVLDGSQWDDKFLDYDYIGAPWLYVDGNNVGNGGFSLRSMMLMGNLSSDSKIEITHPEDEIICRLYRAYLERFGVLFAPEELAHKFSFELNEPMQPTFGFHGNFHPPYKPLAIVRRMGAMGDVIMTEPLLETLYNDGYRVVLDTPEHFYKLFEFHRFPVEHVNKVRKNLFFAPDVKIIDLDMVYENKPQQPALQSYYEAAGITDGDLRNSRLTGYSDQHTKMFKKYAVVHIDDTDMPWRNVGVNQAEWEKVWMYLSQQGYFVVQVGKGSGKTCGVKMNTQSEGLLNFLISGADLFIGVGSAPLHIAVALNVKSVGFFGSVNPELRYYDFGRLQVLQGECPRQNCYHEKVGVRGQECSMGDVIPRCTQHTAEQIIEAINELI